MARIAVKDLKNISFSSGDELTFHQIDTGVYELTARARFSMGDEYIAKNRKLFTLQEVYDYLWECGQEDELLIFTENNV